MDKQNIFKSSSFHADAGDIVHVLIKDLTGEGFAVSLTDSEGTEEDTYDLINDFLFYGYYSEISAGRMPNKVDGATDYLIVAGVPGSETYRCPNTSAYINSDSDYVWFEFDGTPRTVTTAELIGYDFTRTLVSYDSSTPYQIRMIGILKYGLVLTIDEENNLRDSWGLSIWWNNLLSFHGCLKNNRLSERSVWTPVYTLIGDCSALVATTYSDSQINLSCTIGSTEEDGISWERSLDGVTGWIEMGTTGHGINTYSSVGLTIDTKYYYRCRAFKSFEGGLYVYYSAYTAIIGKWTNIIKNNYNWNNPNIDGIAEYWKMVSAYSVTGSLVNGNGFTVDAQRIVENNVNDIACITSDGIGVLVVGVTYYYSFKYRSSHIFYFCDGTTGIDYFNAVANIGDAINLTGNFIANGIYWFMGCLYNVGNWFEIDDVIICRTT